ncbi:hypothetical protein QTP88_025790 [Uroleucon formosanum]
MRVYQRLSNVELLIDRISITYQSSVTTTIVLLLRDNITKKTATFQIELTPRIKNGRISTISDINKNIDELTKAIQSEREKCFYIVNQPEPSKPLPDDILLEIDTKRLLRKNWQRTRDSTKALNNAQPNCYTMYTQFQNNPGPPLPEVTNSILKLHATNPSPSDSYVTPPNEVWNIVKRLPPAKAPGENGITNKALKHLPKIAFILLANIYTSCFRHLYFPVQWKKAQLLDWSRHAKYLGVTLNYNLRFEKHTRATIQKARGARAALYPILNRNSAVPIPVKISTYKIYLRPIVLYAAPIWRHLIGQRTWTKIEAFQNIALCIITGAHYLVTNQNILNSTNIPLLQDEALRLSKCLRYTLSLTSTKLQRRLKTRRNIERFIQRTTTVTIPCATLIEHRHKSIVRSNDDADSDSQYTSAPNSER